MHLALVHKQDLELHKRTQRNLEQTLVPMLSANHT